ncbi:MAG: DUF459 domain-containing protein [Kiritimatiellae bacterium]|nr:DUF459 domain-containing protein [Kiritimatiellia bacterium]
MKTNILRLTIACALSVVSGLPAGAQGTPQRVLIVGDSMMQIPAHSLELALSRKPEVQTKAFTRIGSGLARLDVFDWLAQMRTLVDEFKPDTALVFLGANDHQAMKTGEAVIQPGDAAWEAEYARRVGEAMDLLGAGKGTRVLWLQLPDMKEDKNREDADLMNRIFSAEAAKRGVTFFETRPVLSRTPGKFAPYVIQANGMPLRVRSSDNIHLSREGADLLAAAVIDFLWKATPTP